MSETKSINEQIEELFASNKSDEAKALIQKFLEDEPDSVDAHAWMADTLCMKKEALEHYTFVFDRDINY